MRDTRKLQRVCDQLYKLENFGCWMSRPTVPRVTSDLPKCKELLMRKKKIQKRTTDKKVETEKETPGFFFVVATF